MHNAANLSEKMHEACGVCGGFDNSINILMIKPCRRVTPFERLRKVEPAMKIFVSLFVKLSASLVRSGWQKFSLLTLLALTLEPSGTALAEDPPNPYVKLDNPDALPTGTGHGVAFSHDSTHMAIAHGSSPFVTIYKDMTPPGHPASPCPECQCGRHQGSFPLERRRWGDQVPAADQRNQR